MNKVILIGNLTRDPELTMTANNIALCKFTVAVSRRYTNSDGTRETDFLPVVCWRSQAENCGRYLRKGSKVGICGSIQTRSYEASDGTRRFITEINADEVQFLSSRSADFVDVQELPEIEESKKLSDLKPVDDELPF
ncbi:MAG: single-stranded DNA-binding protein [Bacillota bacterium]|jgi:single-strand DNA-binding protein|nr:single-stranded DNA-binding protein [Bacillota bacterium]HHU43729.1 single-stranded DNA-binding protein [Clostridiales bacterium]